MAGEQTTCSGSVQLNPLPPPTIDSLSFSLATAWADSTGTATATLTWAISSNATNKTYSCGATNGITASPAGGAVSSFSGSYPILFSNVTQPGTGSCTVTASNTAGSVSRSASVNLQPYKPTVVSLAFSPNPAGALTPVTMSWSGNNSPTSYTLIRVDPAGPTTDLSPWPSGSRTEMPHEMGLRARVYTFKVQACNLAGCGESPEVPLTVTPPSPVGAAWQVKDRLGNVLLTIDSQGNGIAPSGLSVFENAAVPQGAVAGAIVLKRRGTNVNVFLFSPAGLYFQGVVLEHQSQATVSAIDSDDLAIRDSGGTPVARFDGGTGNLYLRGHAVVGP